MPDVGEVYVFTMNCAGKEGNFKGGNFQDGDLIEVDDIMIAIDGNEYYITTIPMRLKSVATEPNIYWEATIFERLCNIGVIKLFDEGSIVVEDPKNNDDRDTCYACGAPTKEWIGMLGTHRVCTKCKK